MSTSSASRSNGRSGGSSASTLRSRSDAAEAGPIGAVLAWSLAAASLIGALIAWLTPADLPAPATNPIPADAPTVHLAASGQAA